MAYDLVYSYDSKHPGKTTGPHRTLKAAMRSVKCARRRGRPKTLFKAGKDHWELNCGDTVVADIWRR